MFFDRASAPTDPADRRLLTPEPKQHCAICNGTAPMVIAPSRFRQGFALTPEPAGWMRTVFPWPALEQLNGAIELFRESQFICPPCAGEVAKFIAHRRQPMLGDEDLIG